MDDVNDDINKNTSNYSVEINEKFDKFPESRPIQIYDSDSLDEVIDKMKILVKERNLTSYDQEIYFKRLVESKLKNFGNYRSNYAFRKSQTTLNIIPHNKTQLPSINNKATRNVIHKNDISINDIIKQLPSHIDNSGVYKNQEFVNIYQKRQINDKLNRKKKSVDLFPTTENNTSPIKEDNNNKINNSYDKLNNQTDNSNIVEVINKKSQKPRRTFRFRNFSVDKSRIKLVE